MFDAAIKGHAAALMGATTTGATTAALLSAAEQAIMDTHEIR
jgi:hypothetical protein